MYIFDVKQKNDFFWGGRLWDKYLAVISEGRRSSIKNSMGSGHFINHNHRKKRKLDCMEFGTNLVKMDIGHSWGHYRHRIPKPVDLTLIKNSKAVTLK